MGNYDALYEAAGKRFNVDPALIKAHALHESGENPTMTGSLGEWGMMQFMPKTGAAYGLTPQTAYNPEYAIPAAAHLISDNLDLYTDQSGNVNLPAAIAAYNGSGPMAQRYAAAVMPIYQRLTGQRSKAALPTEDPDTSAGRDYLSSVVSAPPPAVNSQSPTDPDVAAGKAYLDGQASPHQDPDLAAGKAYTDSAVADAKASLPAAAADAPVTVDDYGRPVDMTSSVPTAVSRIATAAAQGATPALVAGGSNFGVGPETTAAMQKAGVFPPADASIGYKFEHPLQVLNEAGANAIAVPANLLARGIGAVVGGLQCGVVQAGQEAEATPLGQAMARTPTWHGLIGIGGPAQLARDIAALPEAFPMGPARVEAAAPAAVTRGNMLLPQEVRSAAAATDATPMLLPQEFRANPTLGGNALVPAAVGETVPNRLLPQQGAVSAVEQATQELGPHQQTAQGTAAPEGAQSAAGPSPGMGGAPAPNSVGAAATPGSAMPALSPAEALAQRTQGERNRFNEPPRGQDTAIYIPGTKPTLAEVAADPKASLQQKVVSQNPNTMEPVATQMQKNNDLSVQFYEDTAGSAQQLERMKAARDDQAATNLQAAFGNKQPTSVTPVQDAIKSILSDPRNSENTALQRYIAPFEERISKMQGVSEGVGPAGQATLMADPEVLYGLREDLNRMLSKPALQKDPELAHVASQVRTVRDAMDGSIEQGAPGYQQYLSDYASASNPIDAMEFLQDARAGLTNTKGQLQPGKFNTLMSNIVEDRATGNPYLPASKLTDDQMERLFSLHSQMKRLGNIDLSNPRGSDTNMLGQAVQKLGLAAAHGVAAYVAPAVGNIGVEMGRNALMSRKANRLLQGVLTPDPRKYPSPPPPMP